MAPSISFAILESFTWGNRWVKQRGDTNRVQIRCNTGKGDREEVSASRDAANVQRLGHVAVEVCHKLDGVGAGGVLAMTDLTSLG